MGEGLDRPEAENGRGRDRRRVCPVARRVPVGRRHSECDDVRRDLVRPDRPEMAGGRRDDARGASAARQAHDRPGDVVVRRQSLRVAGDERRFRRACGFGHVPVGVRPSAQRPPGFMGGGDRFLQPRRVCAGADRHAGHLPDGLLHPGARLFYIQYQGAGPPALARLRACDGRLPWACLRLQMVGVLSAVRPRGRLPPDRAPEDLARPLRGPADHRLLRARRLAGDDSLWRPPRVHRRPASRLFRRFSSADRPGGDAARVHRLAAARARICISPDCRSPWGSASRVRAG